jgi:peptidoglycan/LPS O-acetylase OafA/YrhL
MLVIFSYNKKIRTSDLILIGLWIFSAIVLKILFHKNGLGFLLVYLSVLAFVYFCMLRKIQLKPIEVLGKNSYAIYLSHFLIISFIYRILPFQEPFSRLLLGILLTTIISLFISQITYLLIEKNLATLADRLTIKKN